MPLATFLHIRTPLTVMIIALKVVIAISSYRSTIGQHFQFTFAFQNQLLRGQTQEDNK